MTRINPYLSPASLNPVTTKTIANARANGRSSPSFQSVTLKLLFLQPYKEAFWNFRKAWNLTSSDVDNLRQRRAIHAAIGVLLLVPLINSVSLLVLKHLFTKDVDLTESASSPSTALIPGSSRTHTIFPQKDLELFLFTYFQFQDLSAIAGTSKAMNGRADHEWKRRCEQLNKIRKQHLHLLPTELREDLITPKRIRGDRYRQIFCQIECEWLSRCAQAEAVRKQFFLHVPAQQTIDIIRSKRASRCSYLEIWCHYRLNVMQVGEVNRHHLVQDVRAITRALEEEVDGDRDFPVVPVTSSMPAYARAILNYRVPVDLVLPDGKFRALPPAAPHFFAEWLKDFWIHLASAP